MPLKNGKKIKSGRPTRLLDKDFLIDLRRLVVEEGKTKMTELSKELNVPYDTFLQWVRRNYHGFSDKLLAYRHERRLRIAEGNLDDFLTMDVKNKMPLKTGDVLEFDDTKKMKIKSDVTLFTLETLGKKDFSKRHELTGDDGEPLIPDDVERKKLDRMMKLAGKDEKKSKK